METAPVEKTFTIPGYEDVKAAVVHWPLSVIRLWGTDDERVIDLADHILQKWRGYTDEEAFIFAETDGEPHNTITPIVRMRDGGYELDLALRNNITTEECPLGVYHPHAELHHIKKENIGLIEVMGLAVLPARLKGEMDEMAEYILTGKICVAARRWRNMRTGTIRSGTIIPLRQRMWRAFCRRRSERYLLKCWKTQAYTNVPKRAARPLTVSFQFCKKAAACGRG